MERSIETGPRGLYQYKDVVLPVKYYKDATGSQPCYLYDGHIHTWKDGLFITFIAFRQDSDRCQMTLLYIQISTIFKLFLYACS